jgi:hypothetical protein
MKHASTRYNDESARAIYTPIKIMRVHGDGLQEVVTIEADLRVGDEVRVCIPRFGGALAAYTVTAFEAGRSGRRAVLRTPEGNLLHVEEGDCLALRREDAVRGEP